MMFRRPRVEDKNHLQFIRTLPCVACGYDLGCDPAHLKASCLKYGKREAGTQKPDDRWTTPLCRGCHDKQHSMAEVAFWTQRGIRDPWALCMALHDNSGDDMVAREIIQAHMPVIRKYCDG